MNKDFEKEFLYWAKAALKELPFEIEISQEKWIQIIQYFSHLKEMAEPLGLTALKTAKEYALKHFIDSLTVLPFLEKGPLLDLGTGAGLPGMVIKLLEPEREVWLVDARKKPISFLTYVAGILGLKKLKILKARVGEKDPLPRRYFASVVCRAVKDLSTLWPLVRPLLAPHGVFIALKGPRATRECEELLTRFPHLEISTRQLSLPFTGEQRAIVSVKESPS